MWWPKDIWGKYAGTLEEFKQPGAAGKAVQCLNHMVRCQPGLPGAWLAAVCLLGAGLLCACLAHGVKPDLQSPCLFARLPVSCPALQVTDALGLVGSCLEYMSRLHDPAIFKFCAIPQVGEGQ
jgi:hypothetical protein